MSPVIKRRGCQAPHQAPRLQQRGSTVMIWRIARNWLLLSVAGIALYIALSLAGVVESSLTAQYLPSPGISAIALGALGIAILLALDEQSDAGQEDIEKITFAGLAYILLVKRKSLLAMMVL